MGLRKEDGQYKAYLLDVLRVELELPEVEALIKSQNEADGPALIIIDERGVGMGLLQRLIRAEMPVTGSTKTGEGLETRDVQGVRPSASKIERFGQAILVISDGRIVIPQSAPWLENFYSLPSPISQTRIRSTRANRAKRKGNVPPDGLFALWSRSADPPLSATDAQ
jgi:predicted phage terminase large subunit-like protein